ncbi:ATP-binding domain-containing protein [candidate division WWE3 bacterium]|uniref:ATP-binding domain-containing protein n=1 Tax=candidate division WWE3 bacterium TaxID=2053526 RepID=A0A7X9HGU8_UNCKA|nr:ATP-binding domain-containing protein [candidate division WWE3 bacterium]
MQLSKDQEQVATLVFKWLREGCNPKFITLGGYAGTGKSTLIGYIKNQLDRVSKEKIKIGFCSYTGRAVQNLKNKLTETKSLSTRDTISTIHGLIYKPMENEHGVITGWLKKEQIDVQLIIVDEASMIDEYIWSDLTSYGIPIIAVGDHGQLPPIRGAFNLMQKPLLKLEEIHRQEKDNPIIEVSIHARQKGVIPGKKFGPRVVKYTPEDFSFSEISMELLENYKTDTLVLCGYNTTRNKINQFIRYSLGFETPTPQSGDRVICLRNNHKRGIYNGMLGTIKRIKLLNEQWYDAEIFMDDIETLYHGKIYAPQFGSPEPINFTKDRIKASDGDLFDFGYALTVHKAQGSQAKKVVLFEERFAKMDDDQWKRWLYTAVTRAEEELYIFGA